MIRDYHTLRPFRFWCQKVLPLVYDDSLSYYELLAKVVSYLNKTREDLSYFISNWSNPEVVDDYHDFINPDKIYLYTGEQLGYNQFHWYYYDENSNTWKDGGLYGSALIDDAFDAESGNAVKNSVITDFLKPDSASGYHVAYGDGDSLEYSPMCVTPQMFGAVGDGETDDTVAIQACMNQGEHIFFPSGTYKITSSIYVDDKTNWNLNAENAVITYTGQDYAFKFRHIVNSNIKFGEIISDNGGCIHIYGTDTHTNNGIVLRDWSQYVNIYFNELSANASYHCIYAENNGVNWINEIRLHGGRFLRGANGVKIRHDSTHGISHWVFYNVGVEGVTNGFDFEALNGHSIINLLFIGIRQAEANSVFVTSGNISKVIFLDPDAVNLSKYHLTSDATGWKMLYPTYELDIVDGVSYERSLALCDSLSSAINIPSGTDLNTLLKPGTYYCNNAAVGNTLLNSPVATTFQMTVRALNGRYAENGRYNNIIQEIQSIAGNDARIHRRYIGSGSDAIYNYHPWYLFTGTEVT